MFLKGRNNILGRGPQRYSCVIRCHWPHPSSFVTGKAEGFVSCFHCICDFDSGDCSFTVLKKKPSVQTIFSYVFLLKISRLEIGSGAYLTSHSFDHLTSCSFLPPFHTASYLSSTPLEELCISIPQHTQPPGECNPGITLAASPVGCGPTGSVSCLIPLCALLHPEFRVSICLPSYCTCSGNLDTYV